MGRPSLPAEERRDKVLQILCTASGRDRLRRAATAAGFKSASGWALAVLTAEADRLLNL